MSEWATEKLVEVLKESNWWARVQIAWEKRSVAQVYYEPTLQGWVKGRDDADHRLCWPAALHTEMLALITEIESGKIYGEEHRCAVCGEEGDDLRVAFGYGFNRCPRCRPVVDRYCLGLPSGPAAILRARRLLAESKHADGQEAGEPVLNPKAASRYSLPEGWAPSTFLGRVDDWDVWRYEGEATQPCLASLVAVAKNGLHSELSVRLVENQERLNMYARHSSTRWVRAACAFLLQQEQKGESTREEEPTPVDPYTAQREKEESMEFHDACLLENTRTLNRTFNELTAERKQASIAEASAARRRRVLLGLERGPDPRLILSGDLWDPRRRS